ncbi:MAG: CAP domain-containing protein [Candidatus Andersenbacteria bacterium]
MSIAARSLHGVGVCLIPREENAYKPLALRHKPLAFVSALLILMKVAALGVIALTPSQAELSSITTARVIQFTNAERTKAGLPPLTANAQLSAAAKEKGEHMLAEDYFAHISPSGVTPWYWIQKHGYVYQVAGENLAIDFTEAEDVVAAWMASPSHKDNILHSAYTETGVAVVSGEFQGGTSIIVVHMFGKPSGGQVAAQLSSPTPTPTPVPAAAPVNSPTVAPTPTPSPTPLPTPVPDTNPPRVPRIAYNGQNTTVGNQATFLLEGEPNSTVHVLINSQLRDSVTVSAEGTVTRELNLSNLPDGTVVLRVYSSDSAGNKSSLSDPFTVTKDTSGPEVSADQVRLVIAPQFDTVSATLLPFQESFTAARLAHGSTEVSLASSPTLLSIHDPAIVHVSDESGNETTLELPLLIPQFEFDFKDSELKAPARFSRLTRNMTAAIFITTFILLIVAVLIRVRIQHPALITHASFVVLLAAALFLV